MSTRTTRRPRTQRGSPTPAVLRAGDGDAFADLAGVKVRVFEWVDLLERDPNVDPAQVGRIVASIHRLDFRGRLPTDPWYTEAIGSDRWDALLDALHANGAPFAGRLSEIRDELVALEGLMEEPRELQTCHRDLWADNVLRTTAGGLCVIDWENCGLADPSQELALVLFEFGRDDQRARTLYRAYLEAGGPGRIDRRGNFSMLIAQLGHIGEDACRRWLDPGESEAERERQQARAEQFVRWLDPGESEAERERQQARVEEFVALPLTTNTIDRLLNATTS